MSLSSIYNQSANIERNPTPGVADSQGGAVRNWAILLSGTPCMIQALSANERAMYGSDGVEVTHRMFCNPQSEIINERDRVKIGTIVYDIILVDDVAGLSDHLELTLREKRHNDG